MAVATHQDWFFDRANKKLSQLARLETNELVGETSRHV
jgi:hypothetical protein